MNRVSTLTLVACLMLSTVSLSVSADATEDIPTNAQATGVHDSLVAALAHAGLVEALQADGPFTVFAPTDDAFAAAGIDLANFNTDEANATLTDILLYHVYNGSVESSAVTDGLTVTMLNGDEATFTVTSDSVKVGDATVTTPDVMASNGIIHVIDKVLTPPADEPQLDDIPTIATNTGSHDSLVAALAHAGLVDDLQADGPFTVFAPTDAAFAAAGIDLANFNTDEANATLTDILLYHVYNGSVESSAVTDGLTVTMLNGDEATFTVTTDAVKVGDATVTTADVMASNGVIHVIDKVLMPPADEPQLDDIPTIATNTGSHDSLVAALAHAGLVEALQADGPFTVFAPTDAAFAAAGIDLANFNTDEANATLTDILLYHVYNGSVESSAVTDGLTVTMLNGDEATFTVTTDAVKVGDATVTTADVMASNGVIHVIDKVLMPPADEPVVVDPFEGVDCAATVGIGTSGYAFSPTVVNIAVGETVCWSWEDSSMPHNVKEVTGFKSTTYVENGITSGAAASTVAFHHTFTEDTTFYYACEPHITLDMFGEVVVGDGGSTESTSDDTSESSEDTPGFLLIPSVIAIIGALALMGRQRSED